MFEDRTYNKIMDEMMNSVDKSIDTRQGSVVWDLSAPSALEDAQMYSDLDMMLDETFADTASYYYLIKRAAERGIFVKRGTPAVLKCVVTPSNINIDSGTEFNIGKLNYTITNKLSDGVYSLTCNDIGTEGNNTMDEVIPMQSVSGLETITITDIITSGTDDEDEETLRNRYFDSFEEVSFGGNQAEYKEKANDFKNVTACKVYPVWNGGGTVKLVILGIDHRKASQSVISEVQEAIDPTQDSTGVGIAPIGHVVTVATVDETPVNIACTIEYASGYNWNSIKETFTASVTDYINSLRETWEDAISLIVRTGWIESLLINIDGVIDVTDIKLNGVSSNLNIPIDHIPIVGEISG